MSRRNNWRSEGGSATVETALTLPLIITFILLLLGAGQLAATKVAVSEAARVAARAVAVGYSHEQAATFAAHTCQCKAVTTITTGMWTRVQVRATSGVHTWIPAVQIQAEIALPTEVALTGGSNDQ